MGVLLFLVLPLLCRHFKPTTSRAFLGQCLPWSSDGNRAPCGLLCDLPQGSDLRTGESGGKGLKSTSEQPYFFYALIFYCPFYLYFLVLFPGVCVYYIVCLCCHFFSV